MNGVGCPHSSENCAGHGCDAQQYTIDRKLQSGGPEQQSDAQQKVYQMGDEEADEVAGHTPPGQKQIKKNHIQK